MRNRLASVMSAGIAAAAVAGVGLLVSGVSVSAQAPAAAYRAPRMADGKPNLNGVWQAMNTANWDIQDHGQAAGALWQLGAIGAIPPGQGVVEGNEIPYTAAGLARKKANFENRLKADAYEREQGDPEVKCYLPGLPRASYMPYPFQIVQGQRDIQMVYEYATANRVIHMGKPTEPPVDTWMGWSNGRWEGETLVVDVTGLNGLAWLDRAGNFFTENAHLVERYTATSPNHLQYEVTIEDKTVFTRPWKISMPLYRRMEKFAQLLEFKCVEFSEEALYGKLRKQLPK